MFLAAAAHPWRACQRFPGEGGQESGLLKGWEWQEFLVELEVEGGFGLVAAADLRQRLSESCWMDPLGPMSCISSWKDPWGWTESTLT